MKTHTLTEEDQILLGVRLGRLLRGGEFIELTGDIGSGKTTLIKGIAQGLAIEEDVQSPSFTISRVYKGGDDLYLHHYDFYRLNDAGIMKNDLAEATEDGDSVVAIEWSGVVKELVPEKRISINIEYAENGRIIIIDGLENFPYIKKEFLAQWFCF